MAGVKAKALVVFYAVVPSDFEELALCEVLGSFYQRTLVFAFYAGLTFIVLFLLIKGINRFKNGGAYLEGQAFVLLGVRLAAQDPLQLLVGKDYLLLDFIVEHDALGEVD